MPRSHARRPEFLKMVEELLSKKYHLSIYGTTYTPHPGKSLAGEEEKAAEKEIEDLSNKIVDQMILGADEAVDLLRIREPSGKHLSIQTEEFKKLYDHWQFSMDDNETAMWRDVEARLTLLDRMEEVSLEKTTRRRRDVLEILLFGAFDDLATSRKIGSREMRNTAFSQIKFITDMMADCVMPPAHKHLFTKETSE